MSKVSPDNYVAIQGWMITDLNLKGNELLIYAVIYGFSQDGESQFTGSLQYLADWCNSSKESARKVVKNLLEKQLLIKEDNIVNGIKFCKYRAVKPKKGVDGIQQSCTGIQQSCMGGIQQSCTNNIDINNTEDKIEDKKEYKEKKKNADALTSNGKEIYKKEFETLWSLYPRKQGKSIAEKAYTKARKENPDLYQLVENGIKNYKAYITANNTAANYIKQGSTWFNQHCWEDDYGTGGNATNGNNQTSTGQIDWNEVRFKGEM